jgi:hypothetical protein
MDSKYDLSKVIKYHECVAATKKSKINYEEQIKVKFIKQAISHCVFALK